MELPRINPQYPDIPPWEECNIALVGEAPGKDEVEHDPPMPFVGRAGKLLDEMLVSAGIDRTECHVTNIFLVRPPDNKVAHFFKSPILAKKLGIDICSDLPPYNGTYLRKEFLPELERLADELLNMKPKVIVSLGATPMWAFTGLEKGITFERGTVYSSKLLPEASVLLTLHPAYVLRNRDDKEDVIQDLIKAKQLCA